MNEHLFKLKKDGRTVGYCKWTENWGFKYSLTSDFEEPFTHFVAAQTKSVSAHPFVTKDKNGKDVFAGDRIKRVTAEGCPNPSRKAGREGIVVWHHGFLQWSLKVGTENSYLMEDLADSEIFEAEIELIEEKEDG